MCKIRSIVLLLLICSAAVASAQRSTNKTSPWQTLSGNAPLVIARGGFSGLLPDSSTPAYGFAAQTSLPNAVFWCDLQLTKDDVGICFPDLKLDNASNIASFTVKNASTYLVNGVPTTGYFSVDFNFSDLVAVSLTQGIYSRTDKFDQSQFPILTVGDVRDAVQRFSQNPKSPPALWLNVQHDAFFNQHNLSMRSSVLSITRSVILDYISSPEVNFLRSILTRKPIKTKLVFRFLGSNEIEPSTNLTYSSLLGNLTFVKTFASGILVPKYYVWPVQDLYLQPPTSSIVLDAHKAGLEVFASDFSNDVPFAYNYSYDPVAEYVSFIDNGDFSVDGVLSDFSITASNAIDCFSHTDKNSSGKAPPLVISYKGASGDYPDCTDLAYEKAISDGVDVLDCPVQMTKDGIPVCLGSIDLLESTNVAQSPYSNFGMNIPELKSTVGIFTFNLTWTQIQNLTPTISNPFSASTLFRNPRNANAGKLMKLSEFLALAKSTSVSGVLISIEDAAYLAEKQGLAVTDAVLAALIDSGYNNQTVKRVMIQSTNSSVLIKFKQTSNYELVYHVDETIRDALNSTILDIKKFAHSVVVSKPSVFPDRSAFLTGSTDVVAKLKAFNLSVYAQVFSNEFLSQAWDFFSDPIVEINTYVRGAGIDGVISGFPGTAIKYRKNRCLALGDQIPIYMSPVAPGSLLGLIAPTSLPPAEAPKPVLTEADVVEPPLPSVERNQTTSNGGGSAAVPPTPNGQHKVVSSVLLSSLAVLMATLLLF